MILPKFSNKFFWLFAAVLHLLGLVQAMHTTSIYLVDSIDYLSQAENIKLHNSLYAAPWNGPFRPDYFSFRPPVYGTLIFLIKSVINSDYAILFFQLMLSLSTLWGVKKLAAQLQLNENKSNWLLLAILLFYPSQIIHCNFVMSDILFQSLLFWAFYFTYQFWVQSNYKNSFLAVAFFAIAMLTKPVAFLLGMGIALVLLVLLWKQRKLKLLLPFLILPLVYHSYSSYNKHITGYYHYSSVTPIFVLKYMAKYTNGQLYGEAYADSVQDEILSRVNAQEIYGKRYELMNDEGKKIIAAHPAFFLWFNIKGWLAFMLDPGRFEWVHFLNIPEGNYLGLYHVIHTQGLMNGILTFISNAPLVLLALLAMCLLWNIFISFAFLQTLLNKNRSLLLRLFLFLFVAYIVGSTGVLGLSRYRIAVAPFLWLCLMLFVQGKTEKQDA